MSGIYPWDNHGLGFEQYNNTTQDAVREQMAKRIGELEAELAQELVCPECGTRVVRSGALETVSQEMFDEKNSRIDALEAELTEAKAECDRLDHVALEALSDAVGTKYHNGYLEADNAVLRKLVGEMTPYVQAHHDRQISAGMVGYATQNLLARVRKEVGGDLE